MNNRIKKIFLLIGDILILYLALYIALFLRYQEQPSLEVWNNHLSPFSSIFILWIIIFYIANLYNLNMAVNNSRFFNLSVKSIGISGLLSVVFFYLNPHLAIAPKTNLFIFIIVFSVFFFLWRFLYNRIIYSHLPKNNLLIIGQNQQTDELTKTIQSKPHLGFQISEIIKDDETDKILKIKETIHTRKINTIILATDLSKSKELRNILFSCLSEKIYIISLAHFYEKVTGKIPIEAINKMWFFENLNESNKRTFDITKRVFDFCFALLILLLSGIFWPFIGIIIKLESKGPCFFKQIRTGQNNKKFTIIKFRTMRIENNDQVPTSENDDRITKFGNFMRKTRIDEIPQVLNILMGDMSFIGPRPEQPKLIETLEKEVPFYRERMLVKPGLSGWDQVSGEYHSPSSVDTIKKLQYDLFYIKNRSIYLDLSIILKTIYTVISSAGR